MGDFEGQRWRPYLDKEARERRDEILDHLKRKYDGPSDFVKKKLKEEEALTLEEKIQKYESEIKNKEEKLEKFKRVKKEREQQDRLRDKKELLKDKQDKLKNALSRQGKAKSEIRQEVEEMQLKKKPPHISEDKYLEKKSDRIDRIVESKIESSENVDELVDEIERLQKQVKDLNGGVEDWFMDLTIETMEAKAQ